MAEARQHLEEPARSFTKDGYTIGTIFALVGLFATVGKNERTPGWADALREKINNPRSPLEQVDVDFRLSACIARMGEAAYKQAYT